MLTWTDVSDEAGYLWEVYAPGNCGLAPIQWGTTGVNVTSANVILADGEYRWAVRAMGDGIVWCDSTFSPCEPFYISGGCTPLSSPVAVTPCGQTVSTSNVTLNWSDVANETGFDWEVWNGSVCGSGGLAASGSTGFDVFNTITPPLADGTYSWRVKAKGDGSTWCDSPWSGCCVFDVSTGGCSNLLAPFLSNPCGATVGGNFNLNWSNEANETGYRWEIYPAACGGAPTQWGTVLQDVTSVNVTLPDGSYFWSVKTLGDGSTWCDSPFPPCCNFTVSTCTQLAMPTTGGPCGGASVSNNFVTLNWFDVVNEDGYDWEVWDAPCGTGTLVASGFAGLDVLNTTVNLANGSYNWRVRAKGSGAYCDSLWSGCCAFTVSNNCSPLAPPAPLAPCAATEPSGNVTLSWSDVADEIGYDWQVLDFCGGIVLQNGGTGTNITSAMVTLANGTYDWRVRAKGGAGYCDSAWSACCNFMVNNTACIVLNVPAPGAPCGGQALNDGNAILSWNDVPDDNGYEWRVMSTCGGAPLYSGVTAPDVNSAPVALPSGSYFWMVRARGNGGSFCDSAWSACCDFSVTGSGGCATLAPPTPFGPCGVTTNNGNINLNWGDVPDEIGYEWMITSACGGAPLYFGSTGTDVTMAMVVLPNGSYFWHVRAKGDGAAFCDSPWSPCCSFAVNSGGSCFDDDNDGYTTCAGDCNDWNNAVHPGAPDYCGDGIDQDCNGWVDDNCGCQDQDGDGYTTCQNDCNDWNFQVKPGVAEVCGNYLDDNCNGGVDEGCGAACPDNDGDSWTTCAGDCNDWNPGAFPGAPEICFNWLDDNCNGLVDEWCGGNGTCPDGDGDGWTTCAGDCNDIASGINPGAYDVCGDGLDNNCNGYTDEGCGGGGCPDYDGDGYTACVGDCNDWNSYVSPGAAEVCDWIDNNCNGQVDESCGFCPDADGDGFTVCNGDCNDSNYAVSPIMWDICGDGMDNDCSGLVDEDCGGVCPDADSDGWGVCMGDCDDSPATGAARYPGAAEICDGLDNNCDGVIDNTCGFGGYNGADPDGDGWTTCQGDCDDWNPAVNPGAAEICDWFDNDCDGAVDEGCTAACPDLDGDGYSVCAGDCDDEPILGGASRYPGAAESCGNWRDDNCNGLVDEGCGSASCPDNDLDGWTVCQGDCYDFNTGIYPGAYELCDGFDNNCNGQTDEGCGACADYDADGWNICQGDCDDNNPARNPGFVEMGALCGDGIDNNCNGLADEGCWWAGCGDADGDGWGICSGDCNDASNVIYPGAPEVCDWMDNNCNWLVDEGCAPAGCPDNDGDGWSVCTSDCSDSDNTAYPGAPELQDGKDNDCDGMADEDYYGSNSAPSEPSGDPSKPMTLQITGGQGGSGGGNRPIHKVKYFVGGDGDIIPFSNMGFRQLQLNVEPSPNSETYTVYQGDVGTWDDISCGDCHCWMPAGPPNPDGTIPLVIEVPEDGNNWFIVTGCNEHGESSLGRRSDGTPRDQFWHGNRRGPNQ
jgi:hypothetical protein